MKYLVDLHCHTIASQHAYSTIEEMAKQAKIKGVKGFAITDHGPAAPDAPYRYYFSNLKVIPDDIDGVRIYKGVEANIINDSGEMDLSDNDLKKLDIILAGFHNLTGYGKFEYQKNTKALINLITSGKVDILAHLGNPKTIFDYETVLKKAKEYDVAIEFNNSSFTVSRPGSIPNCTKILEIAKKNKNYISLGSDAHISFDVGNLKEVENLMIENKIEDSQIINSSIENLDRFIEIRQKNKVWRNDDKIK